MSDHNAFDSSEAAVQEARRTGIEKAIELWDGIGEQLRELSDRSELSPGGIAYLFSSIEELLNVARRILIGNEETRLRIPAKRSYSMREVSELLGVEPYVLRYWQSEFGKPPVGRGKRIRYPNYSRRQLQEFLTIKRLCWEEKYTIAGAKRCLFAIREQDSKKSPRRKQKKTVCLEPLQVPETPSPQWDEAVLGKYRDSSRLRKSHDLNEKGSGCRENQKED